MFVEGEVPYVSGGNNGGMMDGNGWWTIILFALIFGWGRGGYGFGGNGGGSEGFGYQLGKLATQEDVASGFTTNTILGVQRDQTLALQEGFSSTQQTLCQGFSGINTALMSGFHGVDNAICTLGYNMASGFNSLGHQISDCCCATQRAIDSVNYNNAKNTADIIGAINCGNQRVLDYMQAEKINALTAENATLKGQLSNNAQSRYIVDTVIDRLSPCPKPAFVVPNPNCCYNFNSGCSGIQ